MRGIIKSLATTFSTFRRRPVTREYPDYHREIPERSRGLPILLWDHEIEEPRCTGCHQCERACPVECMTVLMKDNPNHTSNGGTSDRRKIVDKFWIDYGRCMRCDICVEVCPPQFEAISMNNTWEGIERAVHDRADLVMDLPQLLAQHKQGKLTPWIPGKAGKREKGE